MPDDLTPSINTNAQGPSSVTADGTNAKAQPLKDLIAADQYLKASQRTRGFPGRTIRVRPGGNADLDFHREW